MKKKVKGLVIGKFYPPHEGHHHLISTAEKNSDVVDVIVCERDWETQMPGRLRAEWIKKRHPQVSTHLLKYSDSETDASSEFWAQKTIDFLGYSPDLVFTSEDYGEAYSQLMGAKHIAVDKARITFPVSGTNVRENPYANWDLIDESVRSFYALKVVIVGAESTGKTTFASDLAKELKTVWVPEFGRMYYDAKLASTWKADDFEFIAHIQSVFEEQMAAKSNKVLVCDTDAITTMLWEEVLTGNRKLDPKKYIGNLERRVYFLTDIDIPFEQDGTRDELRRKKMHTAYIDRLKAMGIEYHLLSGDRVERVVRAKSIISQLLR